MESSIPEEAVKEMVNERIEELVSEVEKTVQEYQKQQLANTVEEMTQDVLSELENRGVDTSRANTREIAQESLLETMFGSDQPGDSSKRGERTVKIPVAGRTNEEVEYTELTLKEPDPPTKTIEVPIEAGVEDPDTVKKEVLDYDKMDTLLTGEGLHEPDSRNNVNQDDDDGESGRSSSETVLSSTEKARIQRRFRDDDDESDSDIPVAGSLRYIQ